MSARSRGALALAFTTLGVIAPTAGRAEGAAPDARVVLDWSRGAGAESCMSAEEAATEVERLLSRPVFAPPGNADRRLVVSIDRTSEPHGYRATMTLFAASGAPLGSREITIEAESCERATEAFTLALSIMADLPRTPEESPPPSKAPPAAGHPPPPQPPPPPPPRRPPPARVQAGLGVAAAMETGARVSPGGHVVVLVEPTRFLPVLAGVLSTVRPYETFESRRAWLSSTRVEAALCLPPWRTRAFALFGCLGPEATIHIGWGTGFGEDRTGVSAAFGGVARAYARYALSSHLQLFATIAVAVTPQTLEVAFTDRTGTRRTAFKTSTVLPALTIGAAFDIF